MALRRRSFQSASHSSSWFSVLSAWCGCWLNGPLNLMNDNVLYQWINLAKDKIIKQTKLALIRLC
jgi:hypothetical protein